MSVRKAVALGMASRRLRMCAAAAAIALVVACGGDGGTAPAPPPATQNPPSPPTPIPTVRTVTVTLVLASLMPGQTTEARGTPRDSAGTVMSNPVTWTSSDTTVAQVMANGFVVALGSGVATISGTAGGIAGSAQLSVQAIPPAPFSAVIEYSPAVYAASGGKGLSIIVDAPAGAVSATMTSVGALRRLGNSTRFIALLTDAQVSSTCSTIVSADVTFCGTGTVTIGNGTSAGITISNIATQRLQPGTPAVTVTSLGPMIQRTPYAVNIRDDGLRQSGNTTRVAQLFYQFFNDEFDYIALSELATTNGSIFYSTVRNRATGTGVSLTDNSALYGASASGKLLGFLNFRNYFDLAHQVTSHEMGHAFCCFLRNVALTAGSHWPLSTTAFAIMGSTGNPGSNAGYAKLTPLGDGSYRVEARSPYGGFNNLELYLLGLADSSEVEPQIVFQDQVQSAAIGQTLRGATTTVTIRDIVAANGLRSPAYTGSPVTFRVATVVVSRGRLLTSDEMAVFDRAAQRGEATTSFDGQFTTPFFVNTRGRGVLVTRIP